MAICGSDVDGNLLLDTLTEDLTVVIPDVDFTGSEFVFPGGVNSPIYQSIVPITIDAITQGTVAGSGSFDTIMRSLKVHLQEEFKANRITGSEYTKAYIASMEIALAQSVQFTLTKDNVYWQAVQAQLLAITGRIQMEAAKIQAAVVKLEAENQKGNYALTKMRLASESIQHCISKYNLENVLPKQLEKLTAEKTGQDINNSTLSYTLANLLPKQVDNLLAQKNLINEQVETQRGQTINTRTNGDSIVGTLGKQRELYAQQIDSYKRDAELKAAKLFADAWITQKTIDEGLLPPTGFENETLDEVLTTIKTNNNL